MKTDSRSAFCNLKMFLLHICLSVLEQLVRLLLLLANDPTVPGRSLRYFSDTECYCFRLFVLFHFSVMVTGIPVSADCEVKEARMLSRYKLLQACVSFCIPR